MIERVSEFLDFISGKIFLSANILGLEIDLFSHFSKILSSIF